MWLSGKTFQESLCLPNMGIHVCVWQHVYSVVLEKHIHKNIAKEVKSFSLEKVILNI